MQSVERLMIASPVVSIGGVSSGTTGETPFASQFPSS